LQAGEAAGSVQHLHTATQPASVQRFAHLQRQQLAQHFGIAAGYPAELNAAYKLTFILGERADAGRWIRFGRIKVVLRTSTRRKILRPRERDAQGAESDERCKLVRRWRDVLPQTLIFNPGCQTATSGEHGLTGLWHTHLHLPQCYSGDLPHHPRGRGFVLFL